MNNARKHVCAYEFSTLGDEYMLLLSAHTSMLVEGVLPYFEVTGHPVPGFSLGSKCPDCFIWNCSYVVYPSKMKGPFRDNCLWYYYL